MNNKLLLINAITLLYRESQLEEKNARDVTLLNKVCDLINTSVTDLTIDKEGKMLRDLKATILEMANAPLDVEYDLPELVQKIKIICEHDPNLFEAFRDNIYIELDQEEIKKATLRIRSNFKKYFKEKEAKEIINKYAMIAKFKPDTIVDIGKFISEMATELEPYRDYREEKDPAIVSEIDLSDPDAVERAFTNIQEARDGEAVLRTGFQSINRMLDGGLRYGETLIVGALQHKNKSGFTRSLFKHFCLYNKPYMFNEKKKPLHLLISFEDEMETILEWFYKSLRENEEGVLVDKEVFKTVSPREMSQYVYSRLQANGFYVRMLRVNPSDWTYTDIQNKIIALESEGYEIKCLLIDYLSMIPTTGCTQGPQGVDYRDLFRRMRNFCSARKIAFMTPHQLSTEAKLLVRQDTIDFVKKIANGGYYANSRQIDQEVDTEIYIHIESVLDRDGERFYQTVQRGKRRGTDITPSKDKYACIPFFPIGGLKDDINGVDLSVSKPGAKAQFQIDAGEENPFWLEE